jgi:hypothetical protein
MCVDESDSSLYGEIQVSFSSRSSRSRDVIYRSPATGAIKNLNLEAISGPIPAEYSQ